MLRMSIHAIEFLMLLSVAVLPVSAGGMAPYTWMPRPRIWWQGCRSRSALWSCNMT